MQMVLKPITKQNRAEALTLHVAKGQDVCRKRRTVFEGSG